MIALFFRKGKQLSIYKQKPRLTPHNIQIRLLKNHKKCRGCSSAGRASDLHSEGRRFDPCHLHHIISKDKDVDLVIRCFTTKYADFSGRAGRDEYWLFVLAVFIGSIFISFFEVEIGFLSIIYFLITFIPQTAVFSRRLHDTGRSGQWYFLNLLPFFGQLVLIFFLCQKGIEGDNKYGLPPSSKESKKEIRGMKL